jgi:hypothetical protein
MIQRGTVVIFRVIHIDSAELTELLHRVQTSGEVRQSAVGKRIFIELIDALSIQQLSFIS